MMTRNLIFSCLTLSIALLSLGVVSAQQQPAIDPSTGLIEAQGWTDIQSNCTECHSTQMIIQNSGNREVWKSRIVWMQETQGLKQLGDELENRILDYLALNYGPKESSRRPPLPMNLMPTNPLESTR